MEMWNFIFNIGHTHNPNEVDNKNDWNIQIQSWNLNKSFETKKMFIYMFKFEKAHICILNPIYAHLN